MLSNGNTTPFVTTLHTAWNKKIEDLSLSCTTAWHQSLTGARHISWFYLWTGADGERGRVHPRGEDECAIVRPDPEPVLRVLGQTGNTECCGVGWDRHGGESLGEEGIGSPLDGKPSFIIGVVNPVQDHGVQFFDEWSVHDREIGWDHRHPWDRHRGGIRVL